ncbi:MAG: undecaprenyl-diphosphatase [Proteobacteria bacterium]|nr:undecaprenyl-diphosphatase [Pseudomonadota bacterium]
MDLLHSFWLALVQGLTEFLPISSSAHLILAPRLLGWSDQGLAFDVALHLGTLCAVTWYFRDEMRRMTRAWLATFSSGTLSADGRLAWGVLLGTIPVGMAGLAIAAYADLLRDPMLIAGASVVFGLLLLLADIANKPRRDEYGIGFREIMLIGLALYQFGAPVAASNWYVSGLTMALIVLFALILSRRIWLFRLFPMLSAIVLVGRSLAFAFPSRR